MIRAILLVTFLSFAYAQTPLESLKVEGSSVPEKTVLELSAWRLGQPIDRAGIEAGCRKLEETGLFSSINFQYAETAKHGYAVTLSLMDQPRAAASVDIPGVDDREVWQWLLTKFPAYDRKVPASDAAQQTVARQIEVHTGPRLHGQKLVAKMEIDFSTGKSILSFQPEHLPRIDSMTFAGVREMTPETAKAVLLKVLVGRGYTDRVFRSLLENNLRPAYEERGIYHVQFPQVKIEFVDPLAVAVTITVEEGPKYSLGDIAVVGDDLPAEAMLVAAKFKKGELANWTEIQRSIWEMERPLRRTGYVYATAKPQRVFHDGAHILDLKIGFEKGDFYRFGQFRITGLKPEQEAKVRAGWEKSVGAPYDYMYPGEFMQTLPKLIDLKQFKRYDLRQEKGPSHTMDVTLIFEPH